MLKFFGSFQGVSKSTQPSYIKIILDFINFLTGQIPLQSVPETTPRLLLVQGCLQSWFPRWDNDYPSPQSCAAYTPTKSCQIRWTSECYSSVKKKWNISLVVRRSKSICNENAVDFISLMNYARCTSVTSRQNMYNKLPHSLVIKSSLMNYARRTIVSRRKM